MKQTEQNHLKRVLEYRLAPIISGIILLLLFFITLIPSVKSRAANATIDLDMYGISLTSANPNATATIKTDKLSIYQDTIHTDTASPSGYKLYVSSPNHSNTIYLNDDPVNSTEPNEKFVATAGTFDAPSVLEESTWGYAVAGLNQFDASYDVDNPDQNAKFAAVPLKDEEQLIRTYVGVSTDDTLDVYIGYKTAYRQATGEYSTRLLYTSLSDATSLAVEEAIVTDGSTAPAGYTTGTISIQTSLNTSRTLGDVLVTVGNEICNNVTIVKESPLAVTCNLPILTAGNYDIVVNIPRLGKSYAILNGFTVINPTATITIDTESEWFGAVSQTSVQADYGSTITISGNTVTIGDTNVTAIETPDTAAYTYTFDKWTNNCGDKLVADCKIIASFTRTLTDHTISFVANPENYGTVSPTSLIASYGSDIAIAENTIEINGQTITATPAATTDQYSYTFIDWANGCGNSVILECTITANFSRALRQYTITWNAGTNALVTPTQTVKNYGETLGKLPIPTSTDPELVFVGWFTSTSENREQINENTIVTGGVTYYAIWESKTTKVVLGTNGNLNFVHDINNYNEGETYTDNLGETTVVKKYDLPGKNVSFNSIPWKDERASILSVNFDDSFASVHPTATAYWFYQVEKVASFTNLKNLKMDQVTSMEYMFCNAGYDAENFSLDVSTWNTSNVITMRYLFSGAGRNASTWTITGLENWDMRRVSNIERMFYQAGYKANEFILDTSGWDMTSASYTTSMFEQSGYSAQTYIVDVSNWNATKISNTTKMFASSGHNANTYKIIGIDKWTTSSFAVLDYMFTGAGYNATAWTIGELDNWDVSHVTSMNYTFGDNSSTNPPAYKATSFTLGDLSNWDVSKVVHMNGTFAFAGYNADDWYIGDLSNWIVSSVTELGGTFRGAGGTNPNWSIGDLSNWDVSNVTVTYNLFEYSGRYATRWYVGDLGKWNVSKATKMLCMFSQAGKYSEDFNTGNLNNWNVGSVTNFWSMFSYAGYYANTWSIGDLSGWNTGSVTNFGSMFTESGYNASSWFIGDISNWNTSSATDMNLMFKNAGYHSNTWTIGDISGWDTSSVTNMYMMFYSAGHNADYYMDIHSWNVGNVTNHEYFDSNTGEKILSPWDPIPGPKAILGANGNLNFVYDDLEYIVGNTYTDNLGPTKITAVYDVPVNSHSYTDIAWFQNNNVTSVNFDSTFYTFHPVSTVYWFYADKNLSSVTNAQNLYTSSIIDMSHMFRSAGSEVDTWSIDGLGSWDTSAVTSMAYMFNGAGSGATNWSLNGIDNWDTSAVTDMSGMFWNAGQNATSWSIANISSWDTSSVTKMSSMFANAGLNANYYLDLSGWNVEKVIGHTNFDANVDEKILSPWDPIPGPKAILGANDNLNFVYDDLEYIVGNTYTDNLGSTTVAAVYDVPKNSNVFSKPEWTENNEIVSANFDSSFQVFVPTSTAYWFNNDKKLSTITNAQNLNTSSVTDMSCMFYSAGNDATTWSMDLSTWDTSSVTNTYHMFMNAGQNATTWTAGDLSGWTTSSITNMSGMFYSAGASAAAWTVGDLSGWTTSSVTNMSSLFAFAGQNATTWTVGNLNNWDTSSVTDMSAMFYNAGQNATTWSVGDLGNWITNSVTSTVSMFYNAGHNASTWTVGDLSNWNTSSITNMSYMFNQAGYKATTWSVGDLSNWITNSVTNTSYMFNQAGHNASIWTVGNLGAWNTGSVTDMSNMFSYAGYNATTWSVGDLSTWNTSSVTNMSSMFSHAGYSATYYLDLSDWNVANVGDNHNNFDKNTGSKILSPWD